VARPRRLDQQHLAAAYERDARRLLIWLTRRTYDGQTAVDLVGETYARAWESRRRFRGAPDDPEALAAWTFGIARHVLADALRRGRSERAAMARLHVEPPQLAPDEIAQLEDLAELGSLRATLAVALEDLSPEQRDAVRLRVIEERGYPEIARRLGISEEAVRARVSRGLRTLALAMDGGAA
jgi:RNA polymerase sigma factor (sigma-70 family)